MFTVIKSVFNCRFETLTTSIGALSLSNFSPEFVRSQKDYIKKVTRQDDFINSCLRIFGISKSVTNGYYVTQLPEDSLGYSFASSKFFDSHPLSKKKFHVTRIENVINPFLQLYYELMKLQYIKRYGHVEDMFLFHGTSHINLDNIGKNNFDWRLKGKAY